MMLVGLSVVGLALQPCGFASPAASPDATHRRRAAPRMMPSSTPRVPYKYPGSDSPQWVDIYNRMYRERIMFLSQGIDDGLANSMIAVLLYLESEDAMSPVSMYCNIPGGNIKSGLALYDTIRTMPYDIMTVNMGICANVGAFIVAGGTKGKRYSLPNSRFVMQNPRIDPPVDDEGKPRTRIMQATEMQLEVAEVLRDKKRMLQGFSQVTGRPYDLMEKDFSRDFYLTSGEAMQYGLIDQLLAPKRPDKQKSKEAFAFGTFGGPDAPLELESPKDGAVADSDPPPALE